MPVPVSSRWSTATFSARTGGQSPTSEQMAMVNCAYAGRPGHMLCGLCEHCGRPMTFCVEHPCRNDYYRERVPRQPDYPEPMNLTLTKEHFVPVLEVLPLP